MASIFGFEDLTVKIRSWVHFTASESSLESHNSIRASSLTFSSFGSELDGGNPPPSSINNNHSSARVLASPARQVAVRRSGSTIDHND